jgi:hypothetical protein
MPQAHPPQRKPCGNRDDRAREELDEEKSLDLHRDFVEHLNGDLLPGEGRTDDLHQLPLEQVVVHKQEVREEQDEHCLAHENERPHRRPPHVVRRPEERLLDLHAPDVVGHRGG